jgi:hypothetical protein
MHKQFPGFISFVTLALFTLFFGALYVQKLHASPVVVNQNTKEQSTAISQKETPGKSVVINLTTNILILQNDGGVIDAFPIITQGKPGSYYETLGGVFINDTKEENHFSTIGHVYMPYSVHVFGNYFIHGIPRFLDGTQVSSAYSGGCVRLRDEDAKKVYDFITPGTTITLVQGNEEDFSPTATDTETFTNMDMTRVMAAAISLEFLPQDVSEETLWRTKTRHELLPLLLISKNDEVSAYYARSFPSGDFVSLMNKKAATIGLTNTHFTDTYSPAITSDEDFLRFSHYIMTYKSYLITISTSKI